MIVCSPCWKHNNQSIKLVFDEVPVLTTLWLSLKQFVVKALNRSTKIRFASVDLTKAIDRVAHIQLFQALREQHVPRSYIVLLRAIYFSQSGAVHGSKVFDIQRGVKQGDILSPMLFNAALECALRKWKGKCEHHGIAMAYHERLTSE